MQTILGSKNFSNLNAEMVVAIGNFDGVHLGHKHLIGKAKKKAQEIGAQTAVYTFDPHPVQVLSPNQCPIRIQTQDQKLSALDSLGVNFCIVENFTIEFAHQLPEIFFEEVIIKRLRAKAVVVGYDFTFGLQRRGSIKLLRQLCEQNGIGITVIDAQFLHDTLISSTNIRRLVEHGDVVNASELLGRPYSLEGRVVPGRGIGVTLGARTANLKSLNELIPKNGVYLTSTSIERRAHRSITSIGNNPTFPNSNFAIETHIIDEAPELTGMIITVEFLERLRDQITFASPEELKKQILSDIELAKKLHDKLLMGRG